MDDMKAAVESAPAVEYAYVLERDEVTTTEALMRMAKERADKTDAVGKALDDDNTLVGLPVESFEGVRTSADFFSAYGLSAADGYLFTQDDLEAGNQVIVLGNGLAKTLFPDGGAVAYK